MFVPLGGGTMDGNTMISPLIPPCTNPLLQKVRPELKEMMESTGTKAMKEICPSAANRAKSNSVTIGSNKKELTIPLDLTKSQSTDEAQFLRSCLLYTSPSPRDS